MAPLKRAAIIAAGGPAPGINGVFAGALEVFRAAGVELIGIRDGFSSLIAGDPKYDILSPVMVSAAARNGGSIIGQSRADPKKDIDTVAAALRHLEIEVLVTVGGDDTLKSAGRVAEATQGALRVIHVPKTIDNDLPLPEGVNTFGFATAAEEGGRFVQTLKEDARTTGDRMFVVVCMGRSVGFLPLAVAAASESAVIIPEELPEKVPMEFIIRTLSGAIIRSLALKESTVASRGITVVVAEGVFERIQGFEELVRRAFPDTGGVVFDEHGHLRYSKVPGQLLLEWALTKELAELGVPKRVGKLDVLSEKLGFTLRCAPPNAADREYTTALGRAAAQFGLQGLTRVMVMPGPEGIKPASFDDLLQTSGTAKTRAVNLRGDAFQSAVWRRILPENLTGWAFEQLCSCTTLTPAQFKEHFSAAVEHAEALRRLAAR